MYFVSLLLQEIKSVVDGLWCKQNEIWNAYIEECERTEQLDRLAQALALKNVRLEGVLNQIEFEKDKFIKNEWDHSSTKQKDK